jgi:hypothetical protein
MTKGSRNRRSRCRSVQAPSLAGDAAEEEEKGQSGGVEDVKISPSNPLEMSNDSIPVASSTKSPALASTNILVQPTTDTTASGNSPMSSPGETSNNGNKPKNKTRHFTRSKKPRENDREVHLNGTPQVSSKLPLPFSPIEYVAPKKIAMLMSAQVDLLGSLGLAPAPLFLSTKA